MKVDFKLKLLVLIALFVCAQMIHVTHQVQQPKQAHQTSQDKHEVIGWDRALVRLVSKANPALVLTYKGPGQGLAVEQLRHDDDNQKLIMNYYPSEKYWRIQSYRDRLFLTNHREVQEGFVPSWTNSSSSDDQKFLCDVRTVNGIKGQTFRPIYSNLVYGVYHKNTYNNIVYAQRFENELQLWQTIYLDV